jgi:hypothetical protein
MKRLSRTLDFEMKEGIPAPLLDMPREKLVELVGSLGANWIAGDLT